MLERPPYLTEEEWQNELRKAREQKPKEDKARRGRPNGNGPDGPDHKAPGSNSSNSSNFSRRDPPLPLFPLLPPSKPFPVETLGPVLSRAAAAISRKVQVPASVAAQSVLSVASLVACRLADVLMPYGHAKPLGLFCMTVATSSDRKSSADIEALWPVNTRETALREEEAEALDVWKNRRGAWAAMERRYKADKKLSFDEMTEKLRTLGPEPERPLYPFLVTDDLTMEGLAKVWSDCHPAIGIFAAEGGTFTGGHGMNDENRLRTASMISKYWDGTCGKRIRAEDGVRILPGRRLSLHIMINRGVAPAFLCDPVCRGQGFISRILLASPESLAGTRLYREPDPRDDASIKAYGARLLSVLEAAPPLAAGKRNQLDPPALSLSPEAAEAWKVFYNHVEIQCGPGSALASLTDFAGKAGENAARIAGVIAVIENPNTQEIDIDAMKGAIKAMNWYVAEAKRLNEAGITDPKLLRAAGLLEWLQAEPGREAGIVAILQRGPSPTRTKVNADEALAILAAHRWVVEASHRPRIIRVVDEGSPQ